MSSILSCFLLQTFPCSFILEALLGVNSDGGHLQPGPSHKSSSNSQPTLKVAHFTQDISNWICRHCIDIFFTKLISMIHKFPQIQRTILTLLPCSTGWTKPTDLINWLSAWCSARYTRTAFSTSGNQAISGWWLMMTFPTVSGKIKSMFLPVTANQQSL